MLVSRAPGIKTIYKRNPTWWGKFEGNVQEIVYTPIGNDATRAGRAGLRRDRLRARPGAARRAAAAQHRRREDHRRAGEPHRLHRHGPGPRRAAVRQRARARTRSRTCACARRCTTRSTSRRMQDQADERPELPHRRHHAVAAGHLQRPGDREAPALRPGAGAQADGRGRLSPTASRSRSTARTTATSTTRRSASRWPACGRS